MYRPSLLRLEDDLAGHHGGVEIHLLVDDDQVGAFVSFETADASVDARRPGRIQRGQSDGVLQRQPDLMSNVVDASYDRPDRAGEGTVLTFVLIGQSHDAIFLDRGSRRPAAHT